MKMPPKEATVISSLEFLDPKTLIPCANNARFHP